MRLLGYKQKEDQVVGKAWVVLIRVRNRKMEGREREDTFTNRDLHRQRPRGLDRPACGRHM